MKEYLTLYNIFVILLIWITKVQIIKCFTAEILCGRIPDLTPAQRKMCVMMPDATVELSSAIQIGAEECQHQFQGYRWNCSHIWRPNYFNHVVDLGTREAAFTYAIINAGAVHTIAHACSRGNISRCGCDHPERTHRKKNGSNYVARRSFSQIHQHQQHSGSRNSNSDVYSFGPYGQLDQYEHEEHHRQRHQRQKLRNEKDPDKILENGEYWRWGGCSHDVGFGIKIAKKFFDVREIENDARSLMNLHNNRVGRKIVKNHLRTQCKCHGVSGSCSVKTCWKSLPPFREIGDALMKKYQKARLVKAVYDRKAKAMTLVVHKKEQIGAGSEPKRMDLVYLESSPNYCQRNLIKGSMGTLGRRCNRTLNDVGSCDLLCCGRGYDTLQYYKKTKCHCKFVWCCSVHCDICDVYHEENICK